LILYGIGVGPGDPDLVTLNAMRAIDEADVVFLPVSAVGRQSIAGDIFSSLADGDRKAHEFWFPMTNDANERDREIRRQLEELRPVWEGARRVVIPVIGDSVLFATVSNLYSVWREICPRLELRLLPGISAHSLASSLAGEFLAMGEERLAILPGSAGPDKLAESMRASDCVALYKPSALGERLKDLAESTGPWRRIVRVSRAGMKEQSIIVGDEAIAPTDDYLSIVLFWRREQQ
jgi:precorrin-2/cobalt-factor-2 C20-methyltransferase